MSILNKMKNKLNLPNKIHFIGIGGAGMNPLAGICLKEGIKVTGSDSTPNKNQDELRALGADIWTPHSAEELVERELPEVCIYSTAIPADNPEVIYLRGKGVQFWHRSDLLEKIASNFEKQIVIAGTHGKTTTTAMLVWILEKAGLKPCWVLGGVLKGLGSYGWSDQREIFVFEGDESDQSFLKSKPYIGLVTSLEPDHLENYNNSFEEQIKKFQEFAEKCEIFICCLDCKNIEKSFYEKLVSNKQLCVKKISKLQNDFLHWENSFQEEKDWIITYGKKQQDLNFGLLQGHDFLPPKEIALYNKHQLDTSLWGVLGGYLADEFLPIKIPQMFGVHNLTNALGSLAIYKALSGAFWSIYESDVNLVKDFPGIYRRFEIIGTTQNNITVIDDYAHHPTEVKAAIQAGKGFLKERNKNGKLIVCFQPHLPTRLRDLWQEFTECFTEADQLFLADLYVARGKPIDGINSENLFKQIKHNHKTHILGKAENLIEPVCQAVNAHDLVLILGAGDITFIRERLFEKLK